MRSRLLAAVLAASAVSVPVARAAGLPPCTLAIGQAVEKFVKMKRKVIAACEDRRSSGRLAASVNCRPAAGAVTDSNTANKLANAADKVQPTIDAKCTGALPPLGPACDSATTTALLAACITAPVQDDDVDNRNVDTLIGSVYDANAPVTDPGLQTCQRTISKAGGKYLVSRMKLARICEGDRVNGKVTACPDAKAAGKLETARIKFDGSVRKACTEAQLAANTAPKLDFGFPCETYKLVSYVRNTSGIGDPSQNVLPVLDRAIRCLTDAHAQVADRTAQIAFPGPEMSAFAQGVAAGDATDTAVVFWTRLPDPNASAFLDVSTDSTFATGVQTLAVSSAVGNDGTVKADVGSLFPSTTYFYRFRQGADTSATGRVKTAPAPSDATTVVRLGWTGDSNFFYGPYNSLDPVRLADQDAWFYIGDTIYGDDALADGVVATTFPEYADKYKLNRTDASLRNLMETTGTYAQWDDHEVRNDFAGAVPALAARMAEGNRAFRRYMPLRENGGDPMQLYRSFRIGAGAEFFLIDDRQYRSAKYTCCNDSAESAFVLGDADSSCTGGGDGEALLPSAACTTAMSDPSRTILGATQKQWLKNGLLNSTATFKFIMNGPPVTQLVFLPYDRWEAWSAERNEILDFIESNAIPNVIWLSTDFHTILFSPKRVDVAMSHFVPELVSGSIGENTLFRELPPAVVGLLPSVPALITQITQFELDRYNAALVTIDPAAGTAHLDFKDRSGLTIHSITFTAP